MKGAYLRDVFKNTECSSALRIRSIESIPVLVPIRPEFQIRGSLGFHNESPFSILKVHTDEGIIGLGEVSCTPVWSGEDSVTGDAHHRGLSGACAPGKTLEISSG